MAEVESIVRAKIRPGQLDGFKAVAAEIIRLASEEPKTVRYDWFINEAALETEIHERYVDEQGLTEHGMHIRDARERMFKEFAYDHQLSIFGDVSPQLKEMFKARGMSVGVFSFFQGLNQPATV